MVAVTLLRGLVLVISKAMVAVVRWSLFVGRRWK